MRVLIFSLQYPPRFGGVQQMVYQIVTHLHHEGHPVSVLTSEQPEAAAFDAAQPYKITRLQIEMPDDAGFGEKLAQKWHMFRNVWQAITEFKPDVILCSYWNPEAYILGILSFFRRIPYFVVAHGTEIFLPSSRTPTVLGKNVLRRTAYGRARAIFSVSDFTRNCVIEAGVRPEKIHVIPNGIDASSVVDEIPPRTDTHTLLTVCRLVPRKGVDTVIQSIPDLLGDYPDLHYHVVGDGPERERWQQLSKQLDVAAHVTFHGKVSDEIRDKLYRDCDVFVMPARQIGGDFEGFGITFLEAMAAGIPVIGASSGGIPDVIDHEVTGLRVPPDDPSALAQAIRRPLDDSALRDTLVRNALDRIGERFTWDIVCQQYMNLMQQYR